MVKSRTRMIDLPFKDEPQSKAGRKIPVRISWHIKDALDRLAEAKGYDELAEVMRALLMMGVSNIDRAEPYPRPVLPARRDVAPFQTSVTLPEEVVERLDQIGEERNYRRADVLAEILEWTALEAIRRLA